MTLFKSYLQELKKQAEGPEKIAYYSTPYPTSPEESLFSGTEHLKTVAPVVAGGVGGAALGVLPGLITHNPSLMHTGGLVGGAAGSMLGGLVSRNTRADIMRKKIQEAEALRQAGRNQAMGKTAGLFHNEESDKLQKAMNHASQRLGIPAHKLESKDIVQSYNQLYKSAEAMDTNEQPAVTQQRPVHGEAPMTTQYQGERLTTSTGENGQLQTNEHDWTDIDDRRNKTASLTRIGDPLGRAMAKIAAQAVDPGWWESQKAYSRAMRDSDEGLGKYLAKNELVGSRLKKGLGGSLVGLGIGGLSGAGLGAIAGGAPGAALGGAIGGGLGAFTGNVLGMTNADSEYLRAKGINPRWGGLGGATFSPEAARRYVKTASLEDFGDAAGRAVAALYIRGAGGLEKEAKTHPLATGALLGSAAGAGIGALTTREQNKTRAALIGAGVGGATGLLAGGLSKGVRNSVQGFENILKRKTQLAAIEGQAAGYRQGVDDAAKVIQKHVGTK